MNYKVFLGGCLAAVSMGSFAEIVPASVNETAYLGIAYHSEAKEFRNVRCINFDGVKKVFVNKTSGVPHQNASFYRLNDVFTGRAAAGVKFSSIRFEGDTRFIEKAALGELSESFVFRVETEALITTIDGTTSISEACQFDRAFPQLNGVDVSLEQIPQYIGDSWLSGIVWGGSVNVALKITYGSKTLRDYFTGRITTGAGQSLSLEGELTQEEIEKTANTQVEVIAYQQGGDPAALLRATPNNVLTCNFSEIDNCISIFNNILSYASVDFSEQMTATEDFTYSGNWSALAPLYYFVNSYQSDFSELSVSDNWEVNDKYLLRSNSQNIDYRYDWTIRYLNELESELKNQNWRQEYRDSLLGVYSELKLNKKKLLQAQQYCLDNLSGAKCTAFIKGIGVDIRIDSEPDTSAFDGSKPVIRQFKVTNNSETPAITWDVIGAESCHVTWFDAEGNKESHYGFARTVNIDWHQINYDYRDEYTAEINCIAEDSTLREHLNFTTQTAKVSLNLGDRGHRAADDATLVLPTVISTPCNYYCGGRGDEVIFDIEWHAPTASQCELKRTSTYYIPGFRGGRGNWYTEKLLENLKHSGEYTFKGTERTFSQEPHHENNKFIFSCFDDNNAPIYSTSFFVAI